MNVFKAIFWVNNCYKIQATDYNKHKAHFLTISVLKKVEYFEIKIHINLIIIKLIIITGINKMNCEMYIYKILT